MLSPAQANLAKSLILKTQIQGDVQAMLEESPQKLELRSLIAALDTIIDTEKVVEAEVVEEK